MSYGIDGYYLDHAATVPPMEFDSRYGDSATGLPATWCNPSAAYTPAIMADTTYTSSMDYIYKTLFDKSADSHAGHLFYTSGASESNNWVIQSVINYHLAKETNTITVICSPFEHPSVKQTCLAMESMYPDRIAVHFLTVDSEGQIVPESLEKLLKAPNPVLSCMMMVNNEIGAQQLNLKSLIEMCHDAHCQVLCDYTQAIGKIECENIALLGADFVSFSAHKFGGPHLGFLYAKNPSTLKPFIYGGGQQNNMRSGTIDVASVYEASIALEQSVTMINWTVNRDQRIIAYMREWIKANIEGARINSPANAAAGFLNVSFCGVSGSMLQALLDYNKIYVSRGSACNALRSDIPSDTLQAIGVPSEYINGAIRITLGPADNIRSMADVDKILHTIKECVADIRSASNISDVDL